MSAYETMSGTHIDYAKYMLIAFVACALCSLLFILIGKYVFRPDVSKLKNLDPSKLDTEGSLVLNGYRNLCCFSFRSCCAAAHAPPVPARRFHGCTLPQGIGNTEFACSWWA